MASTDASDLNRVAKTKRQHTATCERCRGQKLRCIRTPQGCERCQKTGAICIVDPNVRMGRPKRGDTGKERRERPEKTTSPRESRSISQSALSATVEWASETNDNMWFRYDPDETRDLAQGPDLFDLDLHNAALGDDHVHSTSASASDDWFDAGGFDQAFPQAPSTNATSYSAEPSPFISIDPPTLTTGGEKRNSQGVSGANTPSTALQGLIERMTSLNLDLHQQSIIAGQIVGDYGNIEPGLMEPPHKDNRLSFAVDSMTQGLQTFHGLLLEIIGMYLNLLPLRFHLDGTQTFEAVLKETRRKAYLAMSHSRLPFDVLLENIDCERSTSFSPLFQAFINYRQGVSETRRFDGATGKTQEISLPRSGYDISLDIIENPGHDTRVILMLQKGLYGEGETNKVLDMYFRLLGDVCRMSGQPLKDISLFSMEDINHVVQLGQGKFFSSSRNVSY